MRKWTTQCQVEHAVFMYIFKNIYTDLMVFYLLDTANYLINDDKYDIYFNSPVTRYFENQVVLKVPIAKSFLKH